jgi:MFS family permease
LWFGGLISMMGDWAMFAALPFYAYEQTNSAFASGAVLTALTVPGLLFGTVAGVFVDRWDRRRTMVLANLL